MYVFVIGGTNNNNTIMEIMMSIYEYHDLL